MSSKLKAIDPIRGGPFEATPEERVRQKLLALMTGSLGYPAHLISVEKSLSELPHLQGRSDLPSRRADLLCFYKVEDQMLPLLLIECKRGEAGLDARDQVLGYNHYVQAPFVALAGSAGATLIHPQALSYLPPYQELLKRL